MTTADQLNKEMEDAKRSIVRCPCGSRVTMKYEPGVTFIYCLGERATKLTLPDWNPTELAKQWNFQHS